MVLADSLVVESLCQPAAGTPFSCSVLVERRIFISSGLASLNSATLLAPFK